MKSKYKIENFIGKSFNEWTVISFSHQDDKKQQYWNFKCSCGNEYAVRTTHVIRGLSKRCKECGTISTSERHWRGGDFISASILATYRNSAQRRNIVFSLTIKDLEKKWYEQNGLCAYTKRQLTLPKHSRDFKYNASIDRIDSKKGYVKSNIEWVMKTINFMKQQLSRTEFIELAKEIGQRKI